MYKIETYLDENRFPVVEKQLVCEERIQANSPDKVFAMLNQYFRLGCRTEEYVYMVALDTKFLVFSRLVMGLLMAVFVIRGKFS